MKRPDLAASGGWFSHAGRDLLSSVVVFLVALPLCMGIALASGVPVELGLITGIVGGLVVGLLAGSPLQVSGPAAGLTVLILEAIHSHGLEALGVIVLGAGLFQILAGVLKLGPWFRAISPAVIQGMLAGIGVLIVAGQFHSMLDAKPVGTGIQNLLAIPGAFWNAVSGASGPNHQLAAGLGVLTIAVMGLWNYLPKAFKLIPGSLVAVLLATFLAAIFSLPVQTVSVPANMLQSLSLPSLGDLGGLLNPALLTTALAIGLIASAETLLSATAVDQMHQGPRTQYNRELFAQGVGNAICGLLGALPMTGVIVRSSANIQAGAKTRLSTILHGGWLLLFVALLPFLLNKIPVAALAAMLVFTGVKLVNVKAIRQIAAYGKTEVAIYTVTVVAIVATNLLEGVLIGLVLSALKLLYTFAHLELDLQVDAETRQATLTLNGSATFLRLPKLAAALERVPPSSELRVRFEGLSYVDHACLDLLMNWEKQHMATGGRLDLSWGELHHRYQQQRPSALRTLGVRAS